MSLQHPLRLVAVVAAAVAITACNKPEDPVKNQEKVAETIAEGQAKVNETAAEAVQDHLDRVVDAEGKPLSEGDMKKDVNSLHKIDVELADANYEVAKKRCDTSTGDAKDQCLATAKADHEAAIAAADARKAGAKAEIEAVTPPQ